MSPLYRLAHNALAAAVLIGAGWALFHAIGAI